MTFDEWFDTYWSHPQYAAPEVRDVAKRAWCRATEQERRTPTPEYAHDCRRCVFLGGFARPGHDPAYYDLYFCDQNNYPTVIGRYGDDGAEYTSGLGFGRDGTIPCLAEAYRRAVGRGLLAGAG